MRCTKPRIVAIVAAVLSLGSCSESGSTSVETTSRLVVSFAARVDTVPELSSRTLTVRVTTSSGVPRSDPVDWISLDPAVATVSGPLVSGIAAGTARVVARVGAAADTCTVLVTARRRTLTAVVLTPATATLTPGATLQFTVAGIWSDGSTTVPAVTYAATGGAITTGGLYTAGTTEGSFRVIASHHSETKADTSIVTITAPAAVLLQLVLSPPSLTLAPGGSGQFTVTGTWTDGSISAPPVTYSATGGTIATGGLFTAGATPGTYRVIATQQAGTKSDTAVVTVRAPTVQPTLRSLATARQFSIGAAVRDTAFARDVTYRQTLVTQYNSIVPEDATDFWPIHPGPAQYSFAAADALVNFAEANGMAFHGHHLVWHAWIPTWVTGGGNTSAQVRDILKDHITTVVGRYRGKAVSWDVVNEVIDNQGCFINRCGLRPSFWLTHLGPEYIDSAFVWAHRADPSAKLYLNDYRTETIMNKSDAVLALAKALKSRGIPIDGVGFQVHILQQYFPRPTSAQVQANFQRFADAGFGIRITEMDVALPDDGGAEALANQAAVYSDILNACLNVSRCTELTTWGFSDRYNWVPKSFPGYGLALPFDLDYQPKPAFHAMLTRLGQP